MTQRERIGEDDFASVLTASASTQEQRLDGQHVMPTQPSIDQGAHLAQHQAGHSNAHAGEVAASLMDLLYGSAAGQLEALAQTMWVMSQQLREQEQAATATYAERTAARIGQLSGYLRAAGPRQVLEDTERLAHREPILFLGGAFAVGFLGARFLRRSRDSLRAGRRLPQGRGVHAAMQRSRISDEVAARLLREAERAHHTMVSQS